MTPVEPDKLGPDLSAYLDGQLSPQRAAEIEALLAESPEARQLLEQLRETSQALRGLARLDAPPALRARLRAELVGRTAGPRRPMLARRWPATLAAAAALLLAVGGWWLLYPSRPSTAPRVVQHSARQPVASGVPVARKPAQAVRPTQPEAPSNAPVAEREAPAVAKVAPRGPGGLAPGGTEPAAADLPESQCSSPGENVVAAAPGVVKRLTQLGYAGGSVASSLPSPDSVPSDTTTVTSVPLVALEVRPAQPDGYLRAKTALEHWREYVQAGGEASSGGPLVVELAVPPDELDDLLADFETTLPQQVATHWSTPGASAGVAREPAPVSAIGVAAPAGRTGESEAAFTSLRQTSAVGKPTGLVLGGAPRQSADGAASPRETESSDDHEEPTAESASQEPAASPQTLGEWIAYATTRLEELWGGVLRMSLSYDTGLLPAPGETDSGEVQRPALAPVPVRIIIFQPPLDGSTGSR